jgi:NADH-quinone oxidoreductase subunit M
VIFGALTKDELKSILDLDRREIAVFAPLLAVTLWMGIYPNSFLGVMHASVDKLLEQSRPAITAVVER